MKRNRNTFFSNYNAQTQAYIPNGMPNFQQTPTSEFGPYTQSSMNSSYYSGPDINSNNELDNRLSKIERQINRLDNRLSKLENQTMTTEIKDNNYTNMYML